MAVLADLGFGPAPEDGRVLLYNCPFHALAAGPTALVCGLNQAFVTGLIDGLGVTGVRADLRPPLGRLLRPGQGTGHRPVMTRP